MRHNDHMKWQGRVTVSTYRGGRLWRVQEMDNLIVNTGRTRLAQLAIGLGTPISKVAVGTDDTPVAATDTALGNEVYRDSVTATANPATGQFQVRLFIGSEQANGNDLNEAALHASDVMVARVVFDDTVSKTSNEALQISWLVTGEAS